MNQSQRVAARYACVVLPFPQIRQEEEHTCGPASLRGLLAFHGAAVPDEAWVAAATGTSVESGSSPETLVALARMFGLSAKVARLTLEEVKAFLRQRLPVILNVQGWGEGHFAVAIGFDSSRLIFADPYRPKRTYIEFSQLDSQWKGDDGRDHLGIVVAPRT